MTEKEKIEQDFMMTAYNSLSMMRLLIEGALEFFMEPVQPLFRLAYKNDMEAAAESLDIIGAALYELQIQTRTLQEEHLRAAMR